MRRPHGPATLPPRGCPHDDAVTVESGGEIVAHLCPTCDAQLPAEWRAA
jgi:hypothetical protein